MSNKKWLEIIKDTGAFVIGLAAKILLRRR